MQNIDFDFPRTHTHTSRASSASLAVSLSIALNTIQFDRAFTTEHSRHIANDKSFWPPSRWSPSLRWTFGVCELAPLRTIRCHCAGKILVKSLPRDDIPNMSPSADRQSHEEAARKSDASRCHGEWRGRTNKCPHTHTLTNHSFTQTTHCSLITGSALVGFKPKTSQSPLSRWCRKSSDVPLRKTCCIRDFCAPSL